MSLPTNARLPRLARGALLAVLLSTVATGALAAGKTAPAAAPKADPRDATISELKAEVQELRDEQAANARKIDTLSGQIDALTGATQQAQASNDDIKAATDTNTADILTLKNPAPAQATLVLNNGKPVATSQDGRFSIAFHGVGQFDTAYYIQDKAGPVATDLRRGAAAGDTAHARDLNSGTTFRRARVGFEGKAFSDFDYYFLYEFGGSGSEDTGHVQEIWGQYNGFKPFKIRVGGFEPLVGLEANVSTGSMPLMERPAPAEVARNVAAGDSRSAIQVFGNGAFGSENMPMMWMVSGAVTGNTVGTVNSAGSIGTQPFGEQLAYTGRAALAPFGGSQWVVHVGLNAQYVQHPNDAGGPDIGAAARTAVTLQDRPELRVDGTRLVSTGGIDSKHAYVYGLELAGQYENFYAEGEYFKYGLDRRNSLLSNPTFNGWYLEGSWILTGERRKYNVVNAAFDGPSPLQNFSLDDHTWGAFEVAARYSDLNLNFHEGAAGAAPLADSVRGGEQKIWTLGLNWYLNPTIRFMIEAQDVKIDRLAPNGFSTPNGAEIGQHYNTVAVRSQVQF